MKLPLPRPIFPNLEITPADEEEFATLVDVFIDKLLVEEHTFRVTNRGRVDTTKWKHLRQSENTSVYRERAVTTTSTPSTRSDSGGSHRLIPPLLNVGKQPGSLDDLLYGFSGPTREASLIQASYVDASIGDVEVLHCIRRPKPNEPFSHVSIKWLLLAPHVSIITPRDYVYIDAIGTRELPSGEVIGYRFLHSIKLTGADPMTERGFIRPNFSISTILRKDAASQHVLDYGRAFYAPGGAIPHIMFTTLVAMEATTTGRQLLTGQLKKLALALRRKHAGQWTVAVPPSGVKTETNPNQCGVCTKKLNMFTRSRFECSLCSRKLCHSCCVRKVLSFLQSDYSTKRLRIAFCTLCVQQAINMPSTSVAADEYCVDHQHYYRQPDTLQAEGAAAASTLRNLFSG